MEWFAYIFLLLGAFLLLLIPFAFHIIRTRPMSILRPQWRNVTTPGFAVAVGIILLLAALLGGLWAIWTGIHLLPDRIL